MLLPSWLTTHIFITTSTEKTTFFHFETIVLFAKLLDANLLLKPICDIVATKNSENGSGSDVGGSDGANGFCKAGTMGVLTIYML